MKAKVVRQPGGLDQLELVQTADCERFWRMEAGR